MDPFLGIRRLCRPDLAHLRIVRIPCTKM